MVSSPVNSQLRAPCFWLGCRCSSPSSPLSTIVGLIVMLEWRSHLYPGLRMSCNSRLPME